MGRLESKIAIVTGGAQGQGDAIVRAFVAEGARVAIADVADEAGKALADELGASACFVHHDVADEESWSSLVEEVRQRWGAPSVLANNAGILRFASLEEMTLEEFETVYRVNQRGCFLGMRAVVPGMREAGGGSIINASSVEGLGGIPGVLAYCGTKFAIRGMTKSAALELGPDRIRVNSVHPGMIDTAMTRVHGGDAAMEYGGSKVALGRVGQAHEVAPLYVYLGSDESSYVTGAEIAVDGGATATHAFGG